MPVNLNLLPPELSVSKSLGNVLKTIRSLGVIGVVAFLIAGAGLGAYMIVSTISLNKTNANIDSLKKQVSAQQKTEQQIILLKDRIGKINSILKLPSSLPNLESIEKLLSGLSPEISINQMKVDPEKISFSVSVQTNADLTTLITSLRNADAFKLVTLKSFSLSPYVGYSAEIEATRK